jgi:imidazolonepropionase-like amidohydrolase
VLVDAGKIVRVDAGDRAPDGYEAVDARGRFVLPGLIDAHSHIGLQTAPRIPASFEIAENSDPLMPQVRIIDSINTSDPAIALARSMGITTAIVLPGSSDLIGGQGVVIKTRGPGFDTLIATDRPILKMALGINPKSAFGTKGRSPKTRMGTAALLREKFEQARAYAARRAKGDGEIDLALEPLIKAMKGEIPVQIHAVRADEVLMAIRLMDEFGLKGSVAHVYEGYLVATEIARHQVPVVVGPLLSGWEYGTSPRRPIDVCSALVKAGVEISIMTDSYVPDLLLQGAYAVHLGLLEDQALRAITLNPARLTGLDAQIGSLEAGKNADLVILDGPPFALGTRVMTVFIEGQVVFDRAGT